MHEKPNGAPESSLEGGLGHGRARRILVVDDDDGCRSFLAEAFETLGCHALQAGDAGEALRLLTDYRPDLVCSDLRMPGMDGLEFLTLLRTRAPDLPCAVISGCAESGIMTEVGRLGVTACLLKPVRLENLADLLRHVSHQPDRVSVPHAVIARRADTASAWRGDALPLGAAETHLLHKTSQLSLLTQFGATLREVTAGSSTSARDSSRDRIEPLVGRSLDIARRALDAEQVSLCLQEEERVCVVSVSGRGTRPLPVNAAARHLTAGRMEWPWRGTIEDRPIVASPLMIHGAAVGFLCAGRGESSRAFAISDAELLAAFSAQTAVALENATLARQLEQAFQASIATLIVTLEAKHKYTEGHSLRVAEYAQAIATMMELSQLEYEQISTAALLHDLGKVGIRDEVLDKPGALDKEEWEAMRQHPLLGARIVSALGFLVEEARIVRHHHERLDGTGYPDRLRGEAIPLASRVIAVADSFDAMCSARSYRPGMSQQRALAELERGAGTQFDPSVVKAFLASRSSHQPPAKDSGSDCAPTPEPNAP